MSTTVVNTFGDTTINGSALSDIKSANFLVFDKKRGLKALGTHPSYQYVFKVSDAVHEAPVYVASQNKLYMSQLAPPAGFLPQLVVDLNQDPPSLSEYLSDPPVYAPNGGTFYNGSIIWGASGGNNSIGGGEQRVGVRTLDPATNKTATLINNYYGFYFNTVDDLCVHSRTGDIFFTDPRMWASCSVCGVQALTVRPSEYSWFNSLTDTPPQLPSASYRYSQKTGAVFVVDDTLQQPNGIALNSDHTTLYISDTGEH